MSYLYESLSPERFQHFCQALLTEKFPNAQCLPVGQPDGGRDAFFYHHTRDEGRELYVFQVKFGRSANDRDDDFIESVCKSEAPKVKRLMQNGLKIKAYYLLTNVQGTAHLEAGTIDRLNDELSKCLDVPAYCWWRDDLDRRVDGSANIKWSFPEIIRGSDLLQALLQGSIGEDGRRRDDAMHPQAPSPFSRVMS